MYKNSNIINMIESSGSRDIFDENYNIFPEYITFYKHSCYYYELPNVWLVHAGFDFSSPNPFTNTFQMLWIRDMTYDEDMAKGKTIITGHTPRPIDIIKDDIKKSKKIISIDNGCVYKRFAGYGNLLCMDLSTFELIIQPNIDEY